MEFREVVEAVCAGLMTLLSLLYFYHILYLIIPHLKKPRPHSEVKLNRYAVLIAARNEEAVLPHLLESIAAQDYPSHLITTYVVADNCTDNTAAAAQAAGAKVYTRFHTQKVGKGYALHDLLEFIDRTDSLDSYDAFLVFDADNLLMPDYIKNINRTCSDGFEVFCGYRNSKNFGSNWLTSGYSLIFLHDCVHMNRSRTALGCSAIVTGTGFGFTRQLLAKSGGWNFFTLTEDTQFSYWCAANGIKIGYCQDAVLFDEQPTSFRQSWRQRTRWVQGSFQVAVQGGKGLFKGLRKGGWQSWTCFEFLTLSLWGYGTAAAVSFADLLREFLTGGFLAGAEAFGHAALSAYGSLFLIGFLTLVTQWAHIRATTARKLGSLITFPIFLMSFVPIALAAPFQKFQWKPIEHSVAVSAGSLIKK